MTIASTSISKKSKQSEDALQAGHHDLIRWILAFGLTLAVLMDALNGTLFSFSRLHIMGDTAATSDEVSWINIGYLAAKLACFPAASWITGRIGEARAFSWSILLILITSIFSVMDISLDMFISMRVIQGMTGALLLVSAQTILFRLFPSSLQGLVQAVYALGVVMAPTTLTPVIQGWFTDEHSWQGVFWLNTALAPLTFFILVPFWSRIQNITHVKRPFDWLGFGLFTLAMTSLVYVLLQGPRWNWFEEPHIIIWTVIGLGAFILVMFWRVLGQQHSDFFDRSVFSNPRFGFGFFVSFVAGFALFGSAFLIPAYAFKVLHMPPIDAGMLLLPSSLAVGGGLLFAGFLITLKQLNPLKFIPLGICLVMTAMWMLSCSTIESGTHDLWGGLLLRGIGLGFLFLPITLITLNDLQEGQVATGVGLFNFGRQTGGILGISFLSTFLDQQIASNRRILIENINPANGSFQERREAIAQALADRGFDPAVASEGAAAIIQNIVQAQVATLSFNDSYFSLLMLFVYAVPLILLFKIIQKLTGWSG